eukprot:5656325-Heterocapsa_arctica.AAC.1
MARQLLTRRVSDAAMHEGLSIIVACKAGPNMCGAHADLIRYHVTSHRITSYMRVDLPFRQDAKDAQH